MNSHPSKRVRRIAIYSYLGIALTGIGLCVFQLRQLLGTNVPFLTGTSRLSVPIAIIRPAKKPVQLTISSRPWSTPFVQARQRDRAKGLMTVGQYDAALEAAKAFYNVAQLSRTSDGIKLMGAVLGRARGRAIAEVFRREQGIHVGTKIRIDAALVPEPVLATIRVPSTNYQSDIQRLGSHPEDFDSMMGCGNLLLLENRLAEAQNCFEFALQIADGEQPERPDRAAVALEGIARSIRDVDGCARRADAFILALRAASFPPAASNDSPAVRVRAAALDTPVSGIFDDDPLLNAHFQFPEDPCTKAAGDRLIAMWLSDCKSQSIAISSPGNRDPPFSTNFTRRNCRQ